MVMYGHVWINHVVKHRSASSYANIPGQSKDDTPYPIANRLTWAPFRSRDALDFVGLATQQSFGHPPTNMHVEQSHLPTNMIFLQDWPPTPRQSSGSKHP